MISRSPSKFFSRRRSITRNGNSAVRSIENRKLAAHKLNLNQTFEVQQPKIKEFEVPTLQPAPIFRNQRTPITSQKRTSASIRPNKITYNSTKTTKHRKMPTITQTSTTSLVQGVGSEMKKAVNDIQNYDLFIDYTQKTTEPDEFSAELPKQISEVTTLPQAKKKAVYISNRSSLEPIVKRSVLLDINQNMFLPPQQVLPLQ